MPASHRAANNLALLSIASLTTQRVGSDLAKSTLIFFFFPFNSLPLKKSSHRAAGLKRQQRTAGQERELGVPGCNGATCERGANL